MDPVRRAGPGVIVCPGGGAGQYLAPGSSISTSLRGDCYCSRRARGQYLASGTSFLPPMASDRKGGAGGPVAGPVTGKEPYHVAGSWSSALMTRSSRSRFPTEPTMQVAPASPARTRLLDRNPFRGCTRHIHHHRSAPRTRLHDRNLSVAPLTWGISAQDLRRTHRTSAIPSGPPLPDPLDIHPQRHLDRSSIAGHPHMTRTPPACHRPPMPVIHHRPSPAGPPLTTHMAATSPACHRPCRPSNIGHPPAPSRADIPDGDAVTGLPA